MHGRLKIFPRLQAVGLELVMGMVCIDYGIAALIPGPSLMYRLVHASGYALTMTLTMLAAGTLLILGGLLSMFDRRRNARRVRIVGAVASSIVWACLGYAYVITEQYGPVLMTSITFFVVTCVLSLENWG